MVYFYRSSSFFSQLIVSSFPLQCNCVQVWPCRGALVEFYVLIYCTSTLPEAVEQKKTISRFLDTYLNFVYNFLKKLLGGLLHIPTRGSLWTQWDRERIFVWRKIIINCIAGRLRKLNTLTILQNCAKFVERLTQTN